MLIFSRAGFAHQERIKPMKILKNLICLITALAVAAAFCSCSVQKKQDPIEDPQPADDSQQDETEVTEEYYEPYIIGSPMPEPFGEDYVSDGDYNLTYYAATNLKLNYISISFVELAGVDDFTQWAAAASSAQSDYTSVAEVVNLYSLIKRYQIPQDKVREILVKERSGNENEDLTDEDIDILLSSDSEAIAQHFAAETAICKGENLYSLKWIYTHFAEDYAAAGITAEDIKRILPFFEDVGLTGEAKNAIKTKLNAYIDGE